MAYSSIVKPTDNFRTKLYAGNGSARSITFDESANMQPDLMWLKGRDTTASWLCNDAVRGATKRLKLDQTSAESTETGMITSFNTNGFSLGTTSTSNNNGSNYVAFNWKANGAGSANTNGSLNSTVSANTTAGFSIVTYTAGGSSAVSTIGHGLGAVPKMIIVKGRDANSTPDQWMVYHEALGNTKRIKLNSTDAAATGSGYWNNTTPTSSLFTVGSSSEGNSANGVYIAYCFADVTGYSKFGSYIGNASNDGTFVYTGFKPAFVIAKLTSVAGENWYVWDNKRSTAGNVVDKFLYPNLTNAEVGSTNFIDFLSNGFKLRSSSDVLNGSGNTHIYMAFAENPLVANSGTEGVPATAR